jgi:hypothetical protein
MPTREMLEMWLAVIVASFVAKRHFEELTGMTLDEWDELNYQRVMSQP